MNTPTAFFLCTLALATAQLNNYPMWGGIGGTGGMTGMTGMGMGMEGVNNPYLSSFPLRVQSTPISWMNPQMSNMANMAMWRAHPLIRMTSGASSGSPVTGTGGAHASTMSGSVLPPGSEKMPIVPVAMPINIPKVPSSEEILTHMVLSNSHPKHYLDTISDMLYNSETTKTRAMGNPVYMGGINPTRNNPNVMDDCSPQDTTRWNRDLSEWVF